jgi:hypothetical protein
MKNLREADCFATGGLKASSTWIRNVDASQAAGTIEK